MNLKVHFLWEVYIYKKNNFRGSNIESENSNMLEIWIIILLFITYS